MTYKVLATMMLALTLSACTIEEMPLDEGGQTVFAGQAGSDEEQQDSKIEIGTPTTSGSKTTYPALWQTGDAVKVFRISDGKHLGDATLQSGAGSNSGTFLLNALTGGANVRLIYPATASYANPHTLASQQTQSGAGAKSFKDFTFAYSGATTGSFTLKHAVAYVKINVKTSATTDTYYGYKVKKVTFSVPGEKISGDFNVDYATGKVTPVAENSDYVTTSLSTAFTVGTEAKEVWMTALPVNCTGKQVLVTLELSKSTTNVSVTVKFTGKQLTAGKVHSLTISDLTGVMIPADRSKSEYTYNTVKYKKTSDASSWSSFTKNITIDGMNWMDKYLTNTLDKWGGYDGVKPDYVTSGNTAGFWRTGWYKNRPVMVDPDGNVAILHGVNCVRPVPATNVNNETWKPIYDAKFGNDNASWAKWAGKVISEDFELNCYSTNAPILKRYRYNEGGYGNDETTDEPLMHPSNGMQTSHFEITYFLRNFVYDFYFLYPGVDAETTDTRSRFVFLFDPKYLDYIDGEASLLANWFKNDKNFIGYILDNELDFRFSSVDVPVTIYLKNFINLPTEGKPVAYKYARDYARKFMQDRGVEPTLENITEAMDLEFLQDLCEIYYRTAAEAIRRHDPNHLLMGSRLEGGAMPQSTIVAACGKYSDIITMNAYAYYDPTVSGNHYFYPVVPVYDLVGNKPFLITEFYTCSAAARYNGTIYPNGGEGIGWIVQNQTARGQWYQNFCIKLLKLGYIVGWEWFQFYDEYNEVGWKNKGLTNPSWSTYECAPAFRQMHRNIYQVMEYFIDGGVGATGKNAGTLPEGVWE